MTPKKLMTLLALALAFAAPLLFSQGPGNPPDPATRAQHHLQMLTKMLSLTPAQQQQATTIFNNAATGESSLHDSMKTAHQSLQTAIKNNDAAGIDQASTTIGNLTAQMTSTHAKAQAAFYQILTPDQQSKLAEFESHGPGGMLHMRDHGDFPHPPGPGL